MSNNSKMLTNSALVNLFDAKGHTWLVRGGPNGVLGMAPDLQSALVQSYEHARANQIVQAAVRQPSDNIIVLPDQIARLSKYFTFADSQGRVVKPSGV
jgi:hypothetical protein